MWECNLLFYFYFQWSCLILLGFAREFNHVYYLFNSIDSFYTTFGGSSWVVSRYHLGKFLNARWRTTVFAQYSIWFAVYWICIWKIRRNTSLVYIVCYCCFCYCYMIQYAPTHSWLVGACVGSLQTCLFQYCSIGVDKEQARTPSTNKNKAKRGSSRVK
jgi:hypothetical protein